MIQKSTSLKYEPSLELLLITAKQLLLNRVDAAYLMPPATPSELILQEEFQLKNFLETKFTELSGNEVY